MKAHYFEAILLFFQVSHFVVGISGPDAEVFEYADPSSLALPGIQLLDQAGTHGIERRGIADPGAPTAGPPVVFEDNHAYYNRTVAINHPLSSFYSSEFDRIFARYPTGTNVRMNNAKNLALTISLTFPFHFYGHPVQTIVVTTGGFLYVNEMTHPYLAFSQYIAPLMADFETNSAVSSIKYVDIESAFWVRWENMLLTGNKSVGNFSFQCAIFPNGSIVFDYISIPISMDALRAASATLKVGLSDAFYYDVTVPEHGTVLRKIIKYHELAVPHDHVVTDGVIRFVHLPTCNQQSTCQDCSNKTRAPGFNCSWCYELGRCSSGVDRQLQQWHDADCHYLSGSGCSDTSGHQFQLAPAGRVIATGVCVGLLLLAAVCSLAGALVYGYRHPGSRIGACLIEHRPGRIRERLFGGGGGGGAGGSGAAYKVGGENPYVNFSDA